MDEKQHWTVIRNAAIIFIVLSTGNVNSCKQVLIANGSVPGNSNDPCCSDACNCNVHLCVISAKDDQTVRKDVCDQTFNISKHGHNFNLTLSQTTIDKVDFLFFVGQNTSCKPVKPSMSMYCKSSVSISDIWFNMEKRNCTIDDFKKIIPSKECGRDSTSYVEEACKDKNPTDFILSVRSDNSTSCLTCKNPVSKPERNLTLPTFDGLSSNGAISAEGATQLVNSLSSLLEKMGNDSTASITVGTIKGVIKKLPEKDPTEINVAFSSGEDMSFVDSANVKGFPRSVRISKEACSMAVSGKGPFVGVLLFQNMTQDEKKSIVLENEVLAIRMGAEIANLSDTIDIHFRNVNTKEANASCNSWDGIGKQPNWTTEGCETKESNGSITCECTHLTFFAILMSPLPGNLSSSDVKSLTYITNIGCGLSMSFLVVALFMQTVADRREKWSLADKILSNLFAAMLLLNLSFLVNESVAKLGNFGACVAMAAAMHYAMLATISWFFVQALHLFMQLKKPNAGVRKYMLKICLTGWVTPALVVIPIIIAGKYSLMTINTDDGNSVKMCWITDVGLFQAVNLSYYAVVFVFTCYIFVVVVRHVAPLKPQVDAARGASSIKKKTFSVLGLLCLLGITWAFAFIGHGPLLIPSYYIFTVLNSFQGFFLFLYYYASRKTIAGRSSSESNSGTGMVNSCSNPYGSSSVRKAD